MADMTVAYNASGGSICPARTYVPDTVTHSGTVTFPDSYATGGHAMTLGEPFHRSTHGILFEPKGGYVFEYDWANGKVKAKEIGSYVHVPTYAPTVFTHTCVAVPGCTATNSENADADTPTNPGAIAAAAAVAAGAWTCAEITPPTHGRSVGIVILNDSGGPLNLYEGVSTFTVTGVYNGAEQTDTITFTSTAENKALATAKYRYKYGVKPFDTVTSVVVDNPPADGLKISVAPGSRIGLANASSTFSEAHVLKATLNGAHYATSNKVDATNGTIDLGAFADASNFSIVYWGSTVVTGVADHAATPLIEVAPATNLSTLGTIRFWLYGIS